MIWLETKKFIMVIIGALLNAMSLNLFLIPAEVDPNAFTNIVQTTGIFGFFRKD
jgi:uncharacterized membrane-anchored protein YitT (DUF2179 family)